MQRTALIALVTAVVAAGIAATATIVLTGDDDPETVTLPTLSPGFTPEVTSEVTTPSGSPSGSPTASPASRGGGDPTASPRATATPTPSVAIRAAKSVNCDDDREFCSSTDRMVVASGMALQDFDEASDPKSTSRPTIVMESRVLDKDRGSLGDDEDVAFLAVEVVVSNDTKDGTFVFDKREIVLEIFRNGRLYDSFSTTGSGFEMTPGSKMTGEFDRPITQPGEYSWRAKIWYYRK